MIRSRRVSPQNLSSWLSEIMHGTTGGPYVLRHLTEDGAKRSAVWDDVKGYVQEAHEDVKQKLRKALQPSFSPFKDPLDDPAYGYPQDLHISTLMGYFGEVMAGLIAEHKNVHGKQPWIVPAFLFRFHEVAFQKLSNRRDLILQGKTPSDVDSPKAKLAGRQGNDVLAFLRGPQGEIAAVLVCEAKFLTEHVMTVAKEAHRQLSDTIQRPSGVPELIDLLQDYNTEESNDWRECLRQFWLNHKSAPPRFDMLFYATGNKPQKHKTRVTWLSPATPLAEYTGNRALEVVEVHFQTAPQSLVEDLYRPSS